MTTAVETINREAGDKAKGFRLQKLRAAALMLDAIETHQRAFIFGAVEIVEDVSLTIADPSGKTEYLEEDKNFDSGKNFTIFSYPVLNTLVSFFDIYNTQWQQSNNVILGFYTTAGIGKERKNTLDDGTVLVLPESPVLGILQSGTESDQDVQMIKVILVEEYEKQYKDKKIKGHLQTLKDCSIDNFKKYLSAIRWFFGEADEVQLKNSTLVKIRDSRLFNFKVANKEEVILALILEKLDERQNLPELASRVMTGADIALVFKQAEAEENSQVLDPVWSELRKLESEITDKRNLIEKVRAVCTSASIVRIQRLARLASSSKAEQLNANKSFLALQYRVFQACEEYLCDPAYLVPTTESDLEEIIKEINVRALKAIHELKTDYTYSVSNEITIKAVVMDLVDKCFIAFEKIE
ncbi:MAG: hypothetical protein HY254_13450 [Burkholderiales bacterium]|nr:hypothetical protein [Burkholderiales bacterium]